MRTRTFVVALLSFLPLPVLAATVNNLTDLICLLTNLVGTATPLAMGLALLAFFWGLANFILHAGDEKKRAEGKNIIIWGIIALFVIVSISGILAVLSSTFFGGVGSGGGVFNGGCR